MKSRRRIFCETHYGNNPLESALEMRSAQVMSKMERSMNQAVENAKERQFETIIKKELRNLKMEDITIY